MKYDKNNIFAKIIKKELPAEIIYEDEYTLAFKDAYPVAPLHILVIPKGAFLDYADFISNSDKEAVSRFFFTINNLIKKLELTSFRLITNKGAPSAQSVYHFHMHIISGKQLKGLIADD
jgi:diadenosine tetraphosphate (Ap4A) HIT family hydrolase